MIKHMDLNMGSNINGNKLWPFFLLCKKEKKGFKTSKTYHFMSQTNSSNFP
jgi:hypothetical protein